MDMDIQNLLKENGSILKVYIALCMLSHEHGNKTFKSSAPVIAERAHIGKSQAQKAIQKLIFMGLLGRRIYKIKDGPDRQTLSWYHLKKILTLYPQLINTSSLP